MAALCTGCSRAGVPYEYQGRTFDGLTAAYGERLCPTCIDSLDPLDVAVRFVNPANGDTDVRTLRDLSQYAPGGTRFGGSYVGVPRKSRPKRNAPR